MIHLCSAEKVLSNQINKRLKRRLEAAEEKHGLIIHLLALPKSSGSKRLRYLLERTACRLKQNFLQRLEPKFVPFFVRGFGQPVGDNGEHVTFVASDG